MAADILNGLKSRHPRLFDRLEYWILEPSPRQWRESAWALWKSHGWRGVYFRLLARRVHEPFADAWHKLDFAALLAEHGFIVETDEADCPIRFILARRRDGAAV